MGSAHKPRRLYSGSSPDSAAMSKRYSESLVQDLNNELGTKGDIVKAPFLGIKAGSRASQ